MTYPELKQAAVMMFKPPPKVAGVIILWNAGMPTTDVAVHGHVDGQRDVAAILRQMADRIDADKGRIIQ